jgi:hypothetical protein
MASRKIYQLEAEGTDVLAGRWFPITGIQGSYSYCLGALYMADSYYPCPAYRIRDIFTGEIKDQTRGRSGVSTGLQTF